VASAEINCPGCGEETLLRREPKYDGFVKTGEKLTCSSCGHEFAGEEEVPYKKKSGPSIFTSEDQSSKLDVFADDEKERNCRHCRHYVVNPFTQRCGLHAREVRATDLCGDFERKEEGETEDEPESAP